MGCENHAFEAALAGAMPAGLARFAVGVTQGEPVGTADLLDSAMLARVLGPHSRDRRAVMSVWALEAFEAVLPRLVAGAVLLGQVPGGEVSWVVGQRGITGLRVDRWEAGGFADVASGVLEPFVARVAERGRVSPRVLWANAGHIVEAFLGMLEREAAESPGSSAVRELLTQQMIGGRANGLFAPVRYVDGKRVRRVCCLRFLVPSWRICLICPLPRGHPSRERETDPPA